MKYLEITPGKSLNPNTGEEWRRCDVKVSVGEGESEDDVFQKAMAKLDSWLPNPFNTVSVVKSTPMLEPPVPVNKQIEGYYGIIKECDTKAKLERHRGNIWKTEDQDLIEAFCEKLNQLS